MYQVESQPSPREAIFTRPCSLASSLVQSVPEHSIWHGLKRFETWAYLKQYILIFNQRFTFWGIKEIVSTPISNKLFEFLYLSYWSELILVSGKAATKMYVYSKGKRSGAETGHQPTHKWCFSRTVFIKPQAYEGFLYVLILPVVFVYIDWWMQIVSVSLSISITFIWKVNSSNTIAWQVVGAK